MGKKQSIISEQTLALLNIGQGTIIAIGVVIILYLAANGVVEGDLTIGDFIMLNGFLLQIYLPLNFLGTVFREINHALTDMNRMFNLLDVDDIIPEKRRCTNTCNFRRSNSIRQRNIWLHQKAHNFEKCQFRDSIRKNRRSCR